MAQKPNRSFGEITRRTALKTGVALSSGLALGGSVIGTAGAVRKVESENIIPVDLFVRPEGTGGQEPTAPAPSGDDLLVERTQGLPVDDGTDPDTLDGSQLTWNEFSAIDGEIKVKCESKGTRVKIEADGLVPGALYTAWVVVFEYPGFGFGERNIADAIENAVGWAPLGKDDGSENVFRPEDDGTGEVEAVDKRSPFPNLGPSGEKGDKTEKCLLDHFEVHFIGGWHLDDQNNEESFRPNAVEHFAFIWRDGTIL